MYYPRQNERSRIGTDRSNTEGEIRDVGRNSGRRRGPIQRGKTMLGALSKAYLPPGPLKVRDAIRLLELDGWSCKRTRGSHRQFRHRYKLGTVTIPGHLRDDLSKGTWNSIQKQAGLRGKAQWERTRSNRGQMLYSLEYVR